MKLTLKRAYIPDNSCTLGLLTSEQGCACYIMENPWKDNERNVSCKLDGGNYVCS